MWITVGIFSTLIEQKLVKRFTTICFVFGAMLILNLNVQAQLVNSVEYSLSTAVRPGEGSKLFKVAQDEFISLAKTKGGISGKSEYALERYSKILENKWSTTIVFDETHAYHSYLLKNDELILFITQSDEKNQIAELQAWYYDLSDGTQKLKKTIHKVSVGEWKPTFGKAGAKESFSNALISNINSGVTAPLQYQFQIEYSPSKQRILSYIFDYSQTNLVANAKIMDLEFQKLDSGIVPIDNGYMNYGVGLNDKNEVFILNSNRGGKIVVVKYHLSTRENQFLDIQTASSKRDNLTMKVIKDEIVYVANLNKRDGVLLGVTYAKFNFSTNLIDKVHFHEFSPSLKSGVINTEKSMKINFNEDWKNYDITDFQVNQFEKVVIILEKRWLNLGDATYNPEAQNDLENWKLRTGTAITGNMLIFSFNAADNLMWENYIVKRQETMLTLGLTNSSYTADFELDDRISFLYTEAGKGGALNEIRYLEIDGATGNKHKNLTFENDLKLTPIRHYVLWFHNFSEEMEFQGTQLVLVGKKGFTGKKTFLNLYKL